MSDELNKTEKDLPLEGESPQPEATVNEPQEPVNVLVVDDHEGSLVALQSVLEPIGEHVVACKSGEQALRELLRREFAVIVLDVWLPGMDGFDIATIVRERPSTANTPIIFLTGMSREEPEVSRGYSLGAVDYLIKPVDPYILRSKVRVFVDLFKKTEKVRKQTEQIYLLREREREQDRERERLAVEHRILLKEKEAAEALARKAAELQRSNAELEQFAYIASHDLQEPLRTITSFCNLLRTDYRDVLTGDARDYMRFITDASERMTALIKGVLDHSRIGRAADSTTKVDCNLVVENVLADLAASIAESGCRIESGKLPALIGDPAEFRLLFQNLISNAIKFQKKGRAPRIRISATEEDGVRIFAIADNGVGIDEQHNRRIFDMFQRGRSRGEYEGTGIGLAHCRKIVELYGGKIWVESTLGKGSTFYFSIPV